MKASRAAPIRPKRTQNIGGKAVFFFDNAIFGDNVIEITPGYPGPLILTFNTVEVKDGERPSLKFTKSHSDFYPTGFTVELTFEPITFFPEGVSNPPFEEQNLTNVGKNHC